MKNSSLKNILLAAFYFTLSTVITWIFVDHSHQYSDENKKLLSTGTAGGKWMIQIVAAFFILHEKRWTFIKNIGLTCLIGSLVLLPYCFINSEKLGDGNFFFGSLILSVLLMIIHYRIAVLRSQVSLRWYYGWLVCLAIAISLQLTVVFEVVKL